MSQTVHITIEHDDTVSITISASPPVRAYAVPNLDSELAEMTSHPAVEAATEWLERELKSRGGSAWASELFEAAEVEGFAKRTVDRAKRLVGVVASRESFGAGVLWHLPTTKASA